MKIKILFDFMKVCKSKGIEPTFEGLINYKKYY